MAKYKPGKSGVPTRKVKEIKKKISAEKGKTKSDKDRIADLEKQLSILLARTQQDTQGGKAISNADVKRAKRSLSPMYSAPSDFDRFMNKETMAELKAGASQRDLEQGISRIKENRKGGGKVYTSQNKKYGGGIYPKRGK